MTRILLLENKALPLHRLRMESRRSGVPFLYECAGSEVEFTRLLARGPKAVISSIEGLPSMLPSKIAEQAWQAGVPLFFIGGDTQVERSILAELSGLFAASCRRSRLPWLPMLIERAERESRTVCELEERTREATAQMQDAADQMRAVQKLATIGRLSGSIAHEINNPLESITNLVYLLGVDEQLPAHLRTYVALAEQELKRVTQISKQTLTFYRETEAPVRVHLSMLLDEVLTLYARRLEEKRIAVDRRYDLEEPVLLFPGEMRQVYANLVANAIEATEAGGRIVIRIQRSRRRRHGSSTDGMRVLISDSGSGIAPEVRLKLGQPFFTTKGQRGTGLGLWVSQEIIERYKGDIHFRSASSAERHGTTFRVFVPLNLGPQIVATAGCHRDEAQLPMDKLRLRASGH